MGFWRSVFGLEGEAGERTVASSPDGVDVQDAPYLKESLRRLTGLQELHHRYKGTAHAQQIRTVQEKTKEIHSYLLSRKRGHELELFHLQHTDHFLNTFTVIVDAHQQHHAQAAALRRAAARAESVIRKVTPAAFRKDRKEVKAAHQHNREVSQRAFEDITNARAEVPILAAPQISINTYARIVYLQEDPSGRLISNEIGFTSSPEEKAAFEAYVCDRFGIESVAYMGNTMVYIPSTHSSQPAEMAPVIHWNGCPYVLQLEDCRLFPVSTFRKGR